MRMRAGTVIVLSVLIGAGFALSAARTAELTILEGTGTVVSAATGTETALEPGATFGEGDAITLDEGARASVTFEDGAVMDVTGPASLRLTELTEYARTIDLEWGTINQFAVQDVTTGVNTPYDSFVAVQDGTVMVKIDTMDDRDQVTYKLYEGDDAKVVDGRSVLPLGTDRPIVVDRLRSAGMGPDEGMPGDAGSRVLEIGGHTIELIPGNAFAVEPTGTGGTLVTCTIGGRGFGTVVVDGDSTFYLADGDSIMFDASGNIVKHDGIVHVYAALDIRGIYDEAIADPADSSPIGRRR